MNYEDEPYVRKYTRKTVTHKLLGWEGRAVLDALLGEVDRAGVLDLSGLEPALAVSALTDIPEDIVSVGLQKLMKHGVLELHTDALVWPKFVEGQTAKKSDKVRQRESRERRRDQARSQIVTLGHEMSQPVTGNSGGSQTPPETPSEPVTNRDIGSPDTQPNGDSVTNRDARSQDVTIGHDLSQSVTLSLAEPSRGRRGSARAAPPVVSSEWQDVEPGLVVRTLDESGRPRPRHDPLCTRLWAKDWQLGEQAHGWARRKLGLSPDAIEDALIDLRSKHGGRAQTVEWLDKTALKFLEQAAKSRPAAGGDGPALQLYSPDM